MSKYNFEELKIKFGNNKFIENLEKYINDDEVLKELKWFQIQKKKLNKERNKYKYVVEKETNNHQTITLTDPRHFFVMNMVKNGEDFGIRPVNWPDGFIKAKFVGSVVVGGKKINQKFKIVEVDLENEQLDKLEELCFGEDDIFKTINIRKNSVWFKE